MGHQVVWKSFDKTYLGWGTDAKAFSEYQSLAGEQGKADRLW